jgi:hypothetical protein
MNKLDHISKSLENTQKEGKNVDPGSGIEKFGSGINIPDPQHWLKDKTD